MRGLQLLNVRLKMLDVEIFQVLRTLLFIKKSLFHAGSTLAHFNEHFFKFHRLFKGTKGAGWKSKKKFIISREK